MTHTKRQEAFNLMLRTIEAAKRLALAEREYNDLNARLSQLISDAFPLAGEEDPR